MRFAIISDVHGNLNALRAVLQDAKAQQVDQFLFVGDYCISNPFPDECLSVIRSIPNKRLIRGNEERHLEKLVGQDPAAWTDGQMQATYWCYRHLAQDNLDYLLSLPHRLDFTCENVDFHIAHYSSDFIDGCEFKDWCSPEIVRRYGNQTVTLERLQQDVKETLDNDPDFQQHVNVLPAGVYIFGHTHIQWSFRTADGSRLLINPGSCGLGLDCVTEGIPYTVLEVSATGGCTILERRVPIDREALVRSIRASSLYRQAPVWCKLIMEETIICRERVVFFLRFAEAYANSIGDHRRPFALTTWEEAYRLWEEQNRSN